MYVDKQPGNVHFWSMSCILQASGLWLVALLKFCGDIPIIKVIANVPYHIRVHFVLRDCAYVYAYSQLKLRICTYVGMYACIYVQFVHTYLSPTCICIGLYTCVCTVCTVYLYIHLYACMHVYVQFVLSVLSF